MKKIGYHFDRCNMLFEGKIVELWKNHPYIGPEKSELLLRFFTEGFSQQGANLFYEAPFCFDKAPATYINDRIIETVFEMVRVSRFNHKPSRLQSFFACSSLENIQKWQDTLGRAGKVFEIEFVGDSIELDGRWVCGGINANGVLDMAHIFYCAEQYWMGAYSSNPLPELLIKPPVVVRKSVNSFVQMY